MSFSKSWYVANEDWGENPQAVWDWMVRGYTETVEVARGFQPCGCGCSYGPGLQQWTSQADDVLRYWHKKFEKSAARHMAPSFGQWVKGKYDEAQKVNPFNNIVPGPRRC